MRPKRPDEISGLIKAISDPLKSIGTTALQPILWMFAYCTVALLISIYWPSPTWFSYAVAAAWSLIVVVVLGAFSCLLVNNPELLRSEEVHIRRMEIEAMQMGRLQIRGPRACGSVPGCGRIVALLVRRCTVVGGQRVS